MRNIFETLENLLSITDRSLFEPNQTYNRIRLDDDGGWMFVSVVVLVPLHTVKYETVVRPLIKQREKYPIIENIWTSNSTLVYSFNAATTINTML